MTHLSPQEYVDSSEIAGRLRKLGVTQDQLDDMAFWPRNEGWIFHEWSFRFPEALPIEAIPLVKAYCTLKWLILENPPDSRDKADAQQYLNDVVVAAQVECVAETLARLRERGAAGADACRIYKAEHFEKWRMAAAAPEIACIKSKRRRAELIAERTGCPPAAIETIRKLL